MCVAVPMEILELDEKGRTAVASYAGNTMPVDISLVPVKQGDYVLVHAGCALEILQKDAALEILDLFRALEEA